MVREEMPNSGPQTEVRFWKQRATRFNALMNELSTPIIRNALAALEAARSKTLPVGWYPIKTCIKFATSNRFI